MKEFDAAAIANQRRRLEKSVFYSLSSRLLLLLTISYFFSACQAASIAQDSELNDSTAVAASESGGIVNAFWHMFGVTPAVDQMRTANDVSLQLNENIVDDLSATASTMEPSSNLSHDYDWLASYTDTDTGTSAAQGFADIASWSPYGMFNYLNGGKEGAEIAGNLYQLYMDPDSISYFQMMSTYVKIMMFFMPATGIVQQTCFALAMARISVKAATMYYGGHSTTEIALTLLPDITSAALVDGARRRRDESESFLLLLPSIMQPIEAATSGVVSENFSGDNPLTDVPPLMAYVDSINFPPLPKEAEEEIDRDVSQVVDEYFSSLPAETNRQSLINSLVHMVKFFSLLQLLERNEENLLQYSSGEESPFL